MNERIHERMNERIHERMNERIHERINERIHKRMNERIHERMNERIHERMNERIHERMNERIHERMNERIHERTRVPMLQVQLEMAPLMLRTCRCLLGRVPGLVLVGSLDYSLCTPIYGTGLGPLSVYRMISEPPG